MRAQAAMLLALALPFTAGACSSGTPPKVAEGEEHVDCALSGGARFAPDCAVERGVQDGDKVLIVRHPDGGFRRFVVLKDGRGLAAADGADVAQIAIADNLLEVSVGQDKYRFPFKVKGDAPSH